MTNFSLSKEEIDHFVKFGFIQVPDCFDRAFAKQWTDEAYGRLGYDPNDPSTWEKPIVHMPNDAWVNVKEFSPKAYAVICQLLGGEDRIPENIRWGNGFIVNFSLGADREWIPPSPEAGGWHKDGDFFHHFLDSPEQGLLLIVIWKDIEPRGGGTFFAPDSIKPVAEYLLADRTGLHPFENGFGSLIRQCRDFREATGKAGDVVFMHPYMLHASSQNHSGVARFITNPPVSLREPMNFNRENPADYSPVERTVLHALGVEKLDY
ncbi:MAG TPA: phytanoyl-CoA dioxygenase family protein, partial [Oceanobacillus sp.]|nr:phytanoyl-CoA dioxygenase family protein [Oceanobacillus sp.]